MKSLYQLLEELRTLSPMPSDELITEDLIDRYGDLVDLISGYQDPACIEPLINSFGYGEGYGVYWTVLHRLEEFPQEIVEPHLITALGKGTPGPSMWAACMLGRGRSPAGMPALLQALNHEKPGVRVHAVMALNMIGDASVLTDLQQMRMDPDAEVRAEVEQAIVDLQD